MTARCLLAAIVLALTTTAQAGHLHKEKAYQDAWCTGDAEVVLANGSRADCITDVYAIEVEFAAKYHEAIGQALDYADQTGKQPGILVIIERDKDWRYYRKLARIADKNRIQLWSITPADL